MNLKGYERIVATVSGFNHDFGPVVEPKPEEDESKRFVDVEVDIAFQTYCIPDIVCA